MPDGEPGPRRHWISRVHYQVFAGHPEFEIVRRPAFEDGVERLHPRNAQDGWQFKVKPGVERVRFGDPGWRLGYARDAVNSYFMFRSLRDRGRLPGHLRFQVSMPTPNSVCPPRIFPDAADVAKARAGYQAAVEAELATIVERIPPRDLAIQWDMASEVQDAYGAIKELPAAGMIERNVGPLRALAAKLPDDVELGYHFCFGTLGGWPRFAPDDLGATVALANAAVAAGARRVDWIHIPLLDRSDDAFFAPLARLEPKGARVYLGGIHNMERFAARMAAARKFRPDFGVAAYCGLGRTPPSEVRRILDEHLEALKLAG
jgi:hypothetical protein